MTAKTVLDRFASLAHPAGRDDYFPPDVATDIIDACDAADVAVIGIEGFEIRAGMIRPRLDLIADFSALSDAPWRTFRSQCNAEARGFLRSISGVADIYLSLALADPWRR
jgi:hypothetical protein